MMRESSGMCWKILTMGHFKSLSKQWKLIRILLPSLYAMADGEYSLGRGCEQRREKY